MNVSFAEEHGKQKAGIYYNIVKKAKMTSNHRTIKARLGIRNALNNRRNFAGKYGNFGNMKRGNNIQHRFMRGNMRMMHQWEKKNEKKKSVKLPFKTIFVKWKTRKVNQLYEEVKELKKLS